MGVPVLDVGVGQPDVEGARMIIDAALEGNRIAAADVMTLLRLIVPEADAASPADLDRARTRVGERWSKTAVAQLRERRFAPVVRLEIPRDATPLRGA